MTDRLCRRLRARGNEWRHYAKCVLSFSVYEREDDTKNVAAMMNWADRAGFSEIVLDVSDTLQWHNGVAEDGLSRTQALFVCQRLGTDWLNRHAQLIGLLSTPTRIIRWSHWTDHPAYNDHLKAVHLLMESDSRYRNAIEWDAHDFAMRRIARHAAQPAKSKDYATLKKASLDFMLEESAVHEMMPKELGPFVKIYPGAQPRCLSYLKSLHQDESWYGYTKVTFESCAMDPTVPQRSSVIPVTSAMHHLASLHAPSRGVCLSRT